MPLLDSFVDEASYVAVLSHEMTHWTSTPARLHRDLSRYAKGYARNVLVKSLSPGTSSAFLCADLGITPELEPRPNHASPSTDGCTCCVATSAPSFKPAAHAQRAVDYLPSPGAGRQRECASI